MLTKSYAILVKPQEIESSDDFLLMFSFAELIVTHDYNIQELKDRLKKFELFDFLNVVTIDKTDFDSLYNLMIEISPQLLDDFIEEDSSKKKMHENEKKEEQNDSLEESKELLITRSSSIAPAPAPSEIEEFEQPSAPSFKNIDVAQKVTEFLGKLFF